MKILFIILLLGSVQAQLRDMWHRSVAEQLEDGACLFGSVSGDTMFVINMTAVKTERTLATVKIHAQQCAKKWNFLGVVHTHPQNGCYFSVQDSYSFQIDPIAKFDFVLCESGMGILPRSYIPFEKKISWKK